MLTNHPFFKKIIKLQKVLESLQRKIKTLCIQVGLYTFYHGNPIKLAVNGTFLSTDPVVNMRTCNLWNLRRARLTVQITPGAPTLQINAPHGAGRWRSRYKVFEVMQQIEITALFRTSPDPCEF